MLFIKSYNTPHAGFDITNCVSFATGNTWLSIFTTSWTKPDLQTIYTTKNFYFNRLPRLWNYLPVINTELNLSKIKYKLRSYLWNHFITNFNPDNKCSFSFLCPCINCSKQPKTPTFETLINILLINHFVPILTNIAFMYV